MSLPAARTGARRCALAVVRSAQHPAPHPAARQLHRLCSLPPRSAPMSVLRPETSTLLRAQQQTRQAGFLKRFFSAADDKDGTSGAAAGADSAEPAKAAADGNGTAEEATAEPCDEPVVDERDTKITELSDAVKEGDDKNRRLMAEMQNLRRRNQQEMENAKQFGIQKFSKDLLGIADVLELALAAVPKEELETPEKNPSLHGLHEGLVMTQNMMLKAFAQHGVERLDPLDQPFDPNLHEAQLQAPVPDKEPGTVFVVNKVGYTLHGRLLRSAAVGVVSDPQ